METIPCTIGITAYNEVANIGKLLDSLLVQEMVLANPTEILVVASGCTDGTEDIVREYIAKDDRIRLIVQEKREGKASAINVILRQMKEKIFVLCSADLLPEPTTVEKLVAPFADPEMGIVTARPVPVDDPETFMGFCTHMLWNLHHEMNKTGFKAGEMIAFRKIFERIPYKTSVDEASIEPVIRGQGFIVKYIPEAIVYNKGPDTVEDFILQRRRIYSGHLDIKELLGYSVSTMSGTKILGLLLRNLDWRPKQLVWTVRVILLEVYGRFLGARDYKARKDHSVWEIATSTKKLEGNA